MFFSVRHIFTHAWADPLLPRYPSKPTVFLNTSSLLTSSTGELYRTA
jgi:hypothetical protein